MGTLTGAIVGGRVYLLVALEDAVGNQQGGRGRHLDRLLFVGSASDQGEDIEDAVARRAVPAAGGPLQVLLAEGEVGLPTADDGRVAGRVVVVGVRLFAEQAVDVGAQGHALIGQLGILALFVDPGVDDLLLLFGHLQGIGAGIAAVGHQVGDGQKGADQHFFIIFAGIAAADCRR